MDPALWEVLHEEPEDEETEAIIRLTDGAGGAPGIRIVSRFGPIVTCRLPRSAILEARESEDVASMKASRLLAPEVCAYEEQVDDEVLAFGDQRRAENLQPTGRGVLLGVLDWGADFLINAFRNRDGTTRLLALWDQRGPALPAQSNPYGYGRIFYKPQIDSALRASNPYQALNYHPGSAAPLGGSHGTHVMDIAAGNGRAGGPVGIAPEVSLAFVHLANRATEGLANLGGSVRILEAVDFIRNLAGKRPWVINCSVGRHGGPHDGTTLVEQAFDHVLRESGCLVQSAGNYGNLLDRPVHASGELRPGEIATLNVNIDSADFTPNEIEVWSSGSSDLSIRLEAPTGMRSDWVRLGNQTDLRDAGNTLARIYNRKRDPNNFDNHIDAFILSGAPAGRWSIALRAERSSRPTKFHAWVERDDACARCQSYFDGEQADDSCTISTLANGMEPIAVGAYDAHEPDRRLASFSSAGPTRDGRTDRPSLVAPGVSVLAARSTPLQDDAYEIRCVRKSGTSMAAPHVAGCAALLLELTGGQLSNREIRELILSNTDPACGSDANRTGHGYLNISRAVVAALRSIRKTPTRSFVQLSSPVQVGRPPREQSYAPVEMITGEESRRQEEIMSPTAPSDCYESSEYSSATMYAAKQAGTSQPELGVSTSDGLEDIDSASGDESPSYEHDLDNECEEIVELADSAAQSGNSERSLLTSLLAKSNAGGRRLHSYTPDLLYREVLSGSARLPVEVLAFPGQRLEVPLRGGDLMVRVALGERGLGHTSVLADGRLMPLLGLAKQGMAAESFEPGQYASIVDAGCMPHRQSDNFARLITDDGGVVPRGQLLLRMKLTRTSADWLQGAEREESLLQPGGVRAPVAEHESMPLLICPAQRFTPRRSDTIVLNSREFAVPEQIRVRNWAYPEVTQFDANPPVCRPINNITSIVLHETRGPAATWSPQVKENLVVRSKGRSGIHGYVNDDGTLIQHNDLTEKLVHGHQLNNCAIGFEIINPMIENNVPHKLRDTYERIPSTWDRAKEGSPTADHYLVPPLQQLEAVAQLIQWFMGPPLNIARVWPGIINAEGKTRFIVVPSDPKTCPLRGVIAHGQYRQEKSDGIFPLLYCWLRLEARFTPEAARAEAKQLLARPGIETIDLPPRGQASVGKVGNSENTDLDEKSRLGESTLELVDQHGGARLDTHYHPGVAEAGRSFIIEGRSVTAERRAFNPGAQDRSGRIALTVRVPNMPAGGTVRWSVPPSRTGSISLSGNPAAISNVHMGLKVDIIGLRPGLSEVDVELRDPRGAVIESQKFPLAVPQFVTVNVDPATFNPVLASFRVDADRDNLLTIAKEVCDLLLITANVRTVWLMPPFSETLPPQFVAGGVAAAQVTRAIFRGNPPHPTLIYGRTNPVAGLFGPAVPNETIDIFPGGYDDPVSGTAAADVDEVTNEVVAILISSPLMSTPERTKGIDVLGRLFGETLAHEIGHSLIGPTLTGGAHNSPAVANDLMNLGRDRSFQSRTGFELLTAVSTGTLSELRDHGIGFIDIPTGVAQSEISKNFPVPPTFR